MRRSRSSIGYPEHNLHMLLYAASMDGQGAIAIQAGKDYAKITGESFYHVLTLVRFGRFDEVLQVTSRPKNDVTGGFWDFAQGYAQLKQGNADFAKVYLARVQKTAEMTKGSFRVNTGKNLLGIVGAILDGEIKRTEGDLDGLGTLTSSQPRSAPRSRVSACIPIGKRL